MEYVYVDNFRGFSNTYIPIKDINFFVGENSTGKTSILGLINILSSSTFWMSLDFASIEANFGHFKDIVSLHSSNRKYFSVGLVELSNDSKEKEKKINKFKKVHGILLTFTEDKGMPVLSMLIYSRKNYEYRVRFGKKETKYKKNKLAPYSDVESFLEKNFKNWKTAFSLDKKGYSKIPTNLSRVYPMGLLLIQTIIEENIFEKEKPTGSRRLKGMRLPRSISFPDIAWLAPIRAKPKRTYDENRILYSSEGDHTPYLIRDILDKQSNGKNFTSFIKKIGKDTGLFEDISIKKYTKHVTSPFELNVIINKKKLSINNVGYGISQSLPVLVELFEKPKYTWFAIQQPEVHLHPRAQASLGDIFYQFAIKENKKFLIETHSDYTIDRFRMNYKKDKSLEKPCSQILFFKRVLDGNEIFEIPIGKNGELPQDQPESFRSFFIKEEMDLLDL